MRQFQVTGRVWVGPERPYDPDYASVNRAVWVEPRRGETEAQIRRAAIRQVLADLRWADYDRPRAIPADPLDVTEVGEEPIDVLLRREGAPLLPLFESV